MTFEETARARYSVKGFKSTPVEEEKLNKILEIAGVAPTARNKQSFRIGEKNIGKSAVVVFFIETSAEIIFVKINSGERNGRCADINNKFVILVHRLCLYYKQNINISQGRTSSKKGFYSEKV